MKKIFLALIVFVFLANLASAQEVKHALGLRFGTGYGMGTEITYQHGLSSVNRLELNLEFNGNHEYIENTQNNYSSISVIGLYHWVWPISDGFKWYAGPGGKLGTWNSMIYNSRYSNGIFLSAAGDVGIEYAFPAKIQLALNARPEIGLFNYGSGLNIGLAVRYQF
jgi:hypothetical protein